LAASVAVAIFDILFFSWDFHYNIPPKEVSKATGISVDGLGSIKLLLTDNTLLMHKDEYRRFIVHLKDGEVRRAVQGKNRNGGC
jgi:hypothetical protein